MNCAEAENLIDALVDDELDPPHAIEVESHLARCAACRQVLATRTELRASLRTHLEHHPAPASLVERVRAQVVERARAQGGIGRAQPDAPPRAASRPGWAGMAFAALAGAVVAALLTWTLALRFAVPDASERMVEELAATHTRALIGNHAIDVASSDQHTVKPWFAGKLDFSPSVEDLGAAGYPLLGGRLDYVSGRPAAALVYGRRKHVIDVFVLPGAGGLSMTMRQGINIVHWSRGGLSYWAVSDLNARELAAFRDLFLAAES